MRRPPPRRARCDSTSGANLWDRRSRRPVARARRISDVGARGRSRGPSAHHHARPRRPHCVWAGDRNGQRQLPSVLGGGARDDPALPRRQLALGRHHDDAKGRHLPRPHPRSQGNVPCSRDEGSLSRTAETCAPRIANVCVGVQVPAGADLRVVTGRHGAGTTFCLAAGDYTVTAEGPARSGRRHLRRRTYRHRDHGGTECAPLVRLLPPRRERRVDLRASLDGRSEHAPGSTLHQGIVRVGDALQRRDPRQRRPLLRQRHHLLQRRQPRPRAERTSSATATAGTPTR